MIKYSFVLPVYNEEQNVSILHKRLSAVAEKLGGSYELIFINDGSQDDTLQLIKKIKASDHHVAYISFSRNYGHQAAVTAGLNKVRGSRVAILDADLQDPPEVLPTFFSKLDEGYNVVYAIREKRKESFFKKTAYALFYRLLDKIAQIKIPMDSGDFCVMDRKVVDTLNALPERNRFVRGLRSWIGFRQVGIPYERAARYAGDTKYPLKKLVKLAFDGIFSFSYVPLQLMFYTGLCALLASLIGSIWAVYQRYFTDNYNSVPGFATTIILVMFIGGLQLFSLGIVGEYMRRMYDEIKQRPSYIIDEADGF